MARTIHLQWNRTSGEITPSEGYRLKRNEEVKFIVQPMTARVASTFDTGWSLTFTLKQKGNYDATPLFVVTAFSAVGDGTYTATAQVASAEIDTALEADATETDDLQEIDCVADLSLVITTGNPEKSDTIFVTLQNCVTDEEGDQTPNSNVRRTTAILQRQLTRDLALADGECLIASRYIDSNSYDITLAGDSTLQIL